MSQIILGQDGDIISKEAEQVELSERDKRYSEKKKAYVFDFVGFIIKKEKILAVFPKHFFEDIDYKKSLGPKEKEDNVKLLFEVIRQYNLENKTKATTDKYIGNEANFESDYPFEAFFQIYDYYKKYGIYTEQEERLTKDGKGKISWKHTIQKANAIASGTNLIFLPIYSKKRNNRDVFISECMTFVINYTIRNFSYFIQLQPVYKKECKIDFLKNREYVLKQLYQYRSTIFMDYQKKLINALINFFETYDKKMSGGAIHFKIHNFDAIWESMVNKYLNDYFVSVDKEKNKLIFDYDKRQSVKRFGKRPFCFDKSKHKFGIEPDHFYVNEDDMYVFDSKYYEIVSELNYKQFAYNVLLSYSEYGKGKNIYSALILPGKYESDLHLDLDFPEDDLNSGCKYIIEQFLVVKGLMRNYLNLNVVDGRVDS